jgi:hypothetical protein
MALACLHRDFCSHDLVGFERSIFAKEGCTAAAHVPVQVQVQVGRWVVCADVIMSCDIMRVDRVCLCVCGRGCVQAGARACVRACARAGMRAWHVCMRVFMRACVCVRVCVRERVANCYMTWSMNGKD